MWADDLLYDCLTKLPETEIKKDRAMLFGNILSLLHHVYAMDTVWKSHLTGAEHNLQTRNPEAQFSLEELRIKQNKANGWYANYFANLGADKYRDTIGFEFIGGGAAALTRTEIMHHAVNHSSYHRGHIEGILYQLSVEPPTTDLPVYLRSITT